MSTLLNVYEFLYQKYGEHLVVSYREVPSYLAAIIGAEVSAKIIYFFKEDHESSIPLTLTPSKLRVNKANGNCEDMNLTGSPLKDDCIIETIGDLSLNLKSYAQNLRSAEEEYHDGINFEKARSIINMEEFQCGTKKGSFHSAQGSAWFLCNANDTDLTLFMQYEYSPGYFSRGTITYRGVFRTCNVNSQSLLYTHYNLIRPQPGRTLNTTIENTYYIRPNVVLQCSWNTDVSCPSLIELSSCNVILSQTFCVSECEPSIEDLLNQLRILMIIRDDIISYKDAVNSELGKEPVYRCGRGVEIDEMRETINKVMTDYNSYEEINDSPGSGCDIDAAIRRAKLRQLTDLTDKLWNILKCSSSYRDLKVAFTILFQCAARCNIVNTPTNKNRLAEIIIGVANRRLAIPCLSGSEPLELLLEIGIEKLYKDYEFIFTQSKICSIKKLKLQSAQNSAEAGKEEFHTVTKVRKSLHNTVCENRRTLLHDNVEGNKRMQFDEMIGFKNTNFNRDESATKLAKLFQIHCTLEHLLMIHNNLNTPSLYGDVCEYLLTKPLRIIESIDELLIDKMEINVPARYVRIHLEGKEPNTRRITMSSKNKYREVKSTFYYSMDNFLPPRIAERLNIEEKEFSRENVYYCWLYRKIRTMHEFIKV